MILVTDTKRLQKRHKRLKKIRLSGYFLTFSWSLLTNPKITGYFIQIWKKHLKTIIYVNQRIINLLKAFGEFKILLSPPPSPPDHSIFPLFFAICTYIEFFFKVLFLFCYGSYWVNLACLAQTCPNLL